MSDQTTERLLDSLGFDAAVNPSAELAAVVETFQRHLHMPDPAPLYAVLGAIAANRLDSDPVWLVLVGPSGGGKTELLNALAGLEDVHPLATLTGPAALLSGTSKKERENGARGGLLREVGDFGILVLKDFGSVLSMHREARAEVLAALREIYDGAWTRRVGMGGGVELHWQGKLGLVAGCTPAIDTHHAVMGQLGERFLFYRLVVADDAAQGWGSLEHVGGVRRMRQELRDAVADLFAGVDFDAAPLDLSTADKERLVALAALVVKARSPVVRDAYRREIELVPDAEAPGRLVVELATLLAGLRAIGIPEPEAWRVVVTTGMDSMPSIRRQALEVLVRHGAKTTTEVAATLGLPTETTRRALEDMTAHHVLNRYSPGAPSPDRWEATEQTIDRYRRSHAESNTSETSETSCSTTPDPASADKTDE